MKAISSKLNMYSKSVSIVNNNIERHVLNFLLFSFGVLALLYVLFLGNMVKNILERKSFETQVASLSGEVRNLEITYLSMSNNVDLALSYSLGFKEAKTTFATRKPLGFGSSTSGITKVAQNDL